MKKIVLLVFVSILLSTAVVVRFTRPVIADGTIYIRADGSVEGTTDISTVDNVTYTFTNNIVNQSIVVERDNIVVDGAGYTLQGTGSRTGIYLYGRSNVTIKNTEIRSSWCGIGLFSSSNNTISGNNITNNNDGIGLGNSSNNIFRDNSIANNEFNFQVSGSSLSHFVNDVDASNTVDGKPVCYWINKRDMAVPLDAGYVALVNCTNITVQNLNLTNNWQGALLAYTTNSTITKNTITNNAAGIWLCYSSNNKFYHNNFINNSQQVYDCSWDYPGFPASLNVWDDGYPSGGNYWSDYTDMDQCSGPNQDQLGSDGIWDHPYVIDDYNQDNYPIVPEFPTWTSMLLVLIALTAATAIYKRRQLKTPIH